MHTGVHSAMKMFTWVPHVDEIFVPKLAPCFLTFDFCSETAYHMLHMYAHQTCINPDPIAGHVRKYINPTEKVELLLPERPNFCRVGAAVLIRLIQSK